MKEYVKNKWKNILEDHADSQEYFYLTPILYLFSHQMKLFVQKYQKGNTLDIGAGNSPYRLLCKDKNYISMDISIKKNITIVSDAHELPFKDETFDTILCIQVLEHTKKPIKILKEIRRVLKSSGTLILSVPHISYLHDEPNDFYRFTKYGIAYICEETEMSVIEITHFGGFFSLFATFISKILFTYTYTIPIIFKVILFLNKIMIYIVSYLDERIDKNKIFALNYLAAIKKSENFL